MNSAHPARTQHPATARDIAVRPRRRTIDAAKTPQACIEIRVTRPGRTLRFTAGRERRDRVSELNAE